MEEPEVIREFIYNKLFRGDTIDRDVLAMELWDKHEFLTLEGTFELVHSLIQRDILWVFNEEVYLNPLMRDGTWNGNWTAS